MYVIVYRKNVQAPTSLHAYLNNWSGCSHLNIPFVYVNRKNVQTPPTLTDDALWKLMQSALHPSFWCRRAKMRANARSPMLTFTSGVASVIMQFFILLQEVFAQV